MPPSPPPGPSAWYARSLTALAARFPQAARRLTGAAGFETVPAEDRATVEDRSLRQVETFLAAPCRLVQTPPDRSARDSRLQGEMVAFLDRRCRALGLDPQTLPAAPVTPETFLIVLGVGLGHHLPALIERCPARFIVLVEPSPELLQGSLAALDWEALLERNEARGRQFDLILADRADGILKALGRVFLEKGSCFLDGAFVFRHSSTPVLNEVRQGLQELAQLAFMARGFFEDERTMLVQARANLDTHPFHLIGPNPARPRPEPALIIAAGPSLDRSLRRIRKLAGSMVVFSCGTALRACLQNGIIPDFHCETENTQSTCQALKHCADHFDLSQTSLISSVTIDPAAPGLFGTVFFFFRDLTSSTRLLAPEWEIHYTSPTGANTAVRSAAALGFERLYLFGVDCGVRSASRKHAGGTVYHLDGPEFQEFRDHDAGQRFDLPLPGNFGGTVHSDTTLDWSRRMIEGALAAHGLTAFNCSDGARISGATPLPPAQVPPGPHRLDKPALRRDIATTCPHFPAGGFTRARDCEPLSAGSTRFFDELAASLAAARNQTQDLVAFRRQLTAILDETRLSDPAASMIFGTASALLTLGVYYLHRVGDEPRRRTLQQEFLAEYARVMNALRDQALPVIRGCGAGR